MQTMMTSQLKGSLADYDAGIPIRVICYKWGIGKSSLYRWLAIRGTRYRLSDDAMRNLRASQKDKCNAKTVYSGLVSWE